MMKKSKKICIILLGIIIFILLSSIIYFAFGWTMILGGMWIFSPTPSMPQETYGEFPFELTYKINGKEQIISDVYVCEYDGIGFNEGFGKYRKWNGYIKGSGKSAILIAEDADRQIFCFVGDAEFYMNDEKYPEKRPLTPRLYDIKKNSDADSLSPDEIAEFYNIEIVSWIFSDPIENSFE